MVYQFCYLLKEPTFTFIDLLQLNYAWQDYCTFFQSPFPTLPKLLIPQNALLLYSLSHKPPKVLALEVEVRRLVLPSRLVAPGINTLLHSSASQQFGLLSVRSSITYYLKNKIMAKLEFGNLDQCGTLVFSSLRTQTHIGTYTVGTCSRLRLEKPSVLLGLHLANSISWDISASQPP